MGAEDNVGKATPGEEEENRHKGTARLVNVGEDLRGVTGVSERGQGTRAAIDARNTDRDDRDADDNVHERIVTLKTGILGGQDEGRSALSVGVLGVEETLVARGDEKTDEGETDNVEEGNTPEDLLDGTRKGSGRVLRLGGGETDKLRAGVGEGGSDENGAEALEAVLERTRIAPVDVAVVLVKLVALGTTTADENDSNDHEDDDGGELEARAPELLLSVTQSAEDVDDDDNNPENSDPDSVANFLIPVLDGERADSKFERQDNQPLEDLAQGV